MNIEDTAINLYKHVGRVIQVNVIMVCGDEVEYERFFEKKEPVAQVVGKLEYFQKGTWKVTSDEDRRAFITFRTLDVVKISESGIMPAVFVNWGS